MKDVTVKLFSDDAPPDIIPCDLPLTLRGPRNFRRVEAWTGEEMLAAQDWPVAITSRDEVIIDYTPQP